MSEVKQETNGSFTQFFTRSKANMGVKIPVFDLAGMPTPHWIVVRSRLSDAFREAEAECNFKYYEAMKEVENASQEKKQEQHKKLRSEIKEIMIASLIAEWSFEEPLNPQTALQFVREAPQLANQIDVVANQDSRFFTKNLTSS